MPFFGHEVNGVDQYILIICDMCVEIPQFGTKHSFNIAVSAGIVSLGTKQKTHHQPKRSSECTCSMGVEEIKKGRLFEAAF